MIKVLVAGMAAVLVFGLSGLAQADETPDILLVEGGKITWTNVNPALYYTIQWRSSLTTGEWRSVYKDFRDLQSDAGTLSSPMPKFFQIIGHATPQYFRYMTATSHWMEAGYYPATNLSLLEPNLAAENILGGVSIFGVDGNVIESTGNASADQVLAGVTLSKAGESGLTGTMANQAGRGFMPGATNMPIPAGYYSGSGVVTGDAALVTGNIRAGTTIFGVTGDPNVVDTVAGNAVAGDLLADRVAYVGGTAVTGTVATLTLSPGSAKVAEGFYAATNLTMVAPALAADNLRHAVELFGVTGTVLQATGDALVQHVLAGQTFSRADAVDVSGTMPNIGAQTITPATEPQVIAQGYHDGEGEVEGDANLAAGNIKADITIFGVDGNVIESTGNASADQVLAGVTFSKAGESGLTGTMANQAGRGFMPGATNMPIPAGYYSGSGVVTGDAALVTGNIRAGTTIFGVTGDPNVVDTVAGNAVAGDLLADRVAYVGGTAVTGTVATLTLSPGSAEVAEGFYAATNLTAVEPNLMAENIRAGTSVFGITGTYERYEYLVIDLSGGPEADEYPVVYYRSVNEIPGSLYDDAYKTTHLVLRRIPAGTFTMGSPENELGRNADREAQRHVTLTKDFYIGVFQVTQRQWDQVMGDDWPSYFTNVTYRETRPLEYCSWNNIRGGDWPGVPSGSGQPAEGTFIHRINTRTGLAFDLPTEAQWEYACRAGTTTALNSSKNITGTVSCPNLDEVGRYYRNHPGGSSSSRSVGTDGGTAKVGSYLPNAWGLHDMHGNVSDWCLDRFADDAPGSVDPIGAESGVYRVLRGGGWYSDASSCRSAARFRTFAASRGYDVGFRLSKTCRSAAAQ